MNQTVIEKVLNAYNLSSSAAAYGNGHINDTFCIDGKFLLQRINTYVFRNPDELMDNIENVTAFLRKKVREEGGDPERGTLTVIPTKDGQKYYRLDDENVYRMYKFIDNTKSIEDSKTPEDLYRAGAAFGHFQKLLADFPAETLYETIKDFHNTPKRVEALKEAIRADLAGRVDSVKEEIAFALENAVWADTAVNGIADGSLPLRVTHNDTKINNILFDKTTDKVVSIIDLDTVMPGTMLYDFGDALRMGASTAAEDETDTDKIWFDVQAYEAFAKGYLSEMKDYLTPAEIALLPFSAKLMTYECGIRFLADYLNGDTYFKIHREHHNLDRARNQFKLVADIAKKEKELCELTASLL